MLKQVRKKLALLNIKRYTCNARVEYFTHVNFFNDTLATIKHSSIKQISI